MTFHQKVTDLLNSRAGIIFALVLNIAYLLIFSGLVIANLVKDVIEMPILLGSLCHLTFALVALYFSINNARKLSRKPVF